MISVLIVEDHPIVREGVTAVLERERDIDVVGAAETIADGLRLAATLRPDVILLDLKLPDADAIDGVKSFASKDFGVVVFTAHDTDDDVFRAIRGGARGGFGLSGIEDRARLVGGRAVIRSAPGRGTTVTVTVPLERPLSTTLKRTMDTKG